MIDIRESVFWVIIGAAAVTVVPRVLPLVVLSRLALPAWLVRWLGYLPIAVLAALLAEEVLLGDAGVSLPPENLGLLAVAPALLIAARTRSLIVTTAAGVVAMALLRQVFP